MIFPVIKDVLWYNVAVGFKEITYHKTVGFRSYDTNEKDFSFLII